MARRVGWTEAALEDLSATAEYIARDSARYAKTFAREAFAASDTLADLASRGRVVLSSATKPSARSFTAVTG